MSLIDRGHARFAGVIEGVIEDTQDLPMRLTEGRSLLALRRMLATLAPFCRQDANAPRRPRRLRLI
ncbi:MAG: hypothetical protein U1F26_16820 [Lysobacterales bacterium]